ncbi:MAG: hypothetical protein SGBAC_007446 [Bacillariaceae sp.]
MKSFLKLKKKKSSKDAKGDGVIDEGDADWMAENDRYNPYEPYKPPPVEAPGQDEIPSTEAVLEFQKKELLNKTLETVSDDSDAVEPNSYAVAPSISLPSEPEKVPVQAEAALINLFEENEQPELGEKFQTDFFAEFQEPVALYSDPADSPPTEISEDKQKAMDEIDKLVEDFNEQLMGTDDPDTSDNIADDTDDFAYEFGVFGDDGAVGDLDDDSASSSGSDYSSSSGEDEYTEQQELPTKASEKEATTQEEKKEDEAEIAQPSSRDSSSKAGSSKKDAKPDGVYAVENNDQEGGLFAGMSLQQMFWDDIESEVDEDDVDTDSDDMDDSDNEDGATGTTGPNLIVDENVKSDIGLEVAPSGDVESANTKEKELLAKATEEESPETRVGADSIEATVEGTMKPQDDTKGLDSTPEGSQGSMVLLKRFVCNIAAKDEQEPGMVHPKATAVRKKNVPFKMGGFSGIKKSGAKKATTTFKETGGKQVKVVIAKTEVATRAELSSTQARSSEPAAAPAAVASSVPEMEITNEALERQAEARSSEPAAAPAAVASSVPEMEITNEALERQAAETEAESEVEPRQEQEVVEENPSDFAAFSAMIHDVYQFAIGNLPKKGPKGKSPKEIWAEPARDRGFETCQSSGGGEPKIQKAISRDEPSNSVSPVLYELHAKATAPPSNVDTSTDKSGPGGNETPATTPTSSAGSLSPSAEEATGPDIQKLEEQGYEVRRGQAADEIHEVASGKEFEFSQKIQTIFRATTGKKTKKSEQKKSEQKKSKSSWFGRRKGKKTTKQ